MGKNNNNLQISLFSESESESIINTENIKFKKNKITKNTHIKFNISHSIIVQESLDLFSGNFDDNVNKKNDTNNLIQLSNIKGFKTHKNNKDTDNTEEDFYESENKSNILEVSNTNNDDEILDVEKENSVVSGLNNFFKEANEYKLLTREEEQKYFKEYNETHNEEIKKFLISSNIKLVISVAKKISKKNKKIPLEDMIDEGFIGLIKAIEKFEPERGYKFSTYAFSWIQQAITRYIANTGDMIRVPVHFSDSLSKIKHFENEYMIQHNVDFVDDEITSKELKISVDKIKRYKKATQNISSLDVVIDENENTRMDITEDKYAINPESSIMNTCLHDALMKVIKTLDKRESFIIINRYNLDHSNNIMSLNEIAEKFNLTKERIRQIESNALKKLAHPMKSKEYREFY